MHESAQSTTDEAMKYEMHQFLKDHADPEHFRLNAKQSNAFKDSWFELYRRGTFKMELWGAFKKLPHIHRFVVEQFTPLDFMSSFGRAMMEEYLAIADTQEQKLFGEASSLLEWWQQEGLGRKLSLTSHPTATCRRPSTPSFKLDSLASRCSCIPKRTRPRKKRTGSDNCVSKSCGKMCGFGLS